LFYQRQSPFFRSRKGAIDRSFAQIELSPMHQIFRQNLQDHLEAAILLPLLKAAMASLIGRITVG